MPQALTQLLQTQTNKEKTINYNFSAVSPAALFAWKNQGDTGLSLKMYGGYFYDATGLHVSLGEELSQTLLANSTCYFQRNLDGASTNNTTSFSAGHYPSLKVTTDASNITTVEDYRVFMQKRWGKSFHNVKTTTITASTAYATNHAIGISDNNELMVEARLLCKTANNGYAVNDEVVLSPSQATVTLTNSNFAVVQFGATVGLLARTTGTPFAINFSQWSLKTRVIRYAHS